MSEAETSAKKLWLDDLRRPPSEAWVWAKSVDEGIEILATRDVVEASLDNDLHPFEHDGVEVVEWMLEHQVFPRLVTVHTDNRFASTKMCGLLERSGYRSVPGRPRHFVHPEGRRMSPAEFFVRNARYAPRAMEKLMESSEEEAARRQGEGSD